MRLPVLALLVAAGPGAAADYPQPPAATSSEPRAKELSLAKAAEYLDAVGVNWTRDRDCISCHTNMPYLTARPLLKGPPSVAGPGGRQATEDAGWKEVRKYLEDDVKGWSDGGKPKGDAYVVATAFALAFNDAQQTGRLHDTTKAALDRMWTLQKPSGEWDWLKCAWPPLEHDDYYGAVLAALAVGYAPGDYASSAAAKPGVAKLRAYLTKTPPPDLHHAAMLLWASAKLDGLMTAEERRKVVASLVARQRKDGGWSLPSLGEYRRRDKDKTPNDPDAESDGYGTGLVTYVLLASGSKPTDPAVAGGVGWLRANQRASGRWWTRSLNTDRAHYIANAGTAFAVLALTAAGERPTR